MKIVTGTFKDNADELASFLEPRLGAKPSVSGGEISFDDDSIKKGMRARHVKTYVKRFLNKKGERQNYRVLVEGMELRMIELESFEEEEEEKETKKKATKEQKEEPEEEKAAEEKEEEEKEAKKEESAPVKAKKEAESEQVEEEKKEQSLGKADTKAQTKPKRNKGD